MLVSLSVHVYYLVMATCLFALLISDLLEVRCIMDYEISFNLVLELVLIKCVSHSLLINRPDHMSL